VLEVEGIDIGSYDTVNSEGPVRWLDLPTAITATVEEGRLVAARPAEG